MNAEPKAKSTPAGLRLGLCCQFVEHPVKFRHATAASVLALSRPQRLERLAVICAHNAQALFEALQYCAANGIGSFRVISQILPIKTHPVAGYHIEELPEAGAIISKFQQCGQFARSNNIRTGFHPDQFVVLNSPDAGVVTRSVAELEYQAEVAQWINADTLNIHGGGGYGDKTTALDRLRRGLDQLSSEVRRRITIENDDKTYTPADLLPVCRSAQVPLVYDIHHHRCLPDYLSIEECSVAARLTWNREPLFHLSSPLLGWSGPHPERHHDYIDLEDFPDAWRNFSVTVEVEAKAKELAVLRLREQLRVRKG